MRDISAERPSWKELLRKEKILVLPAAHDALTARLIERAGFRAYQIGGFALVGSMHAAPDVDLEHFGEKSEAARNIIHSSKLPALVDCDDGYGDVKNVNRVIRSYELMGAAAVFIEDQKAPKRCGHMAKKEVIPVEDMEKKICSAVDARRSLDFFILARTDAIEPNGLKDALKRGERYLKAGADGLYFDGVESKRELKKIGSAFEGVPLATSVLERGGKTPVLSPEEFRELNFSMVLYPTTILFRITRQVERALEDLKAGRMMPVDESVDMNEFEDIVDLRYWAELEDRYYTR
ncbi:MAG: isocitrate lyase/PEP mutase family protein [Ignavibacteria bacterium]|jgi:methylisocitrate lyase|nr:isocitrate lyase/PEP mutase family protein [Ignavibacteria bacterium]MCU7502114.1 isocitrate lyase/PEP mutase family protein [Ignavibacteria bacterium]MCU7515516.1 isocitrate lyase/PEP mutase family protein [Ignavibacteria bacterium]